MSIRDRLRKLEDRFRERGPTLGEVQAAWGRLIGRARAKLRGENVDETQRTRDRDTVKRWAKAAGVDLEGEAERAKEKLRNMTGRESRPPTEEK